MKRQPLLVLTLVMQCWLLALNQRAITEVSLSLPCPDNGGFISRLLPRTGNPGPQPRISWVASRGFNAHRAHVKWDAIR
jgi:hypothetical protein